MEYRQLQHFIALAEERGFRLAAAREQIVQSGLSHSIQALERSVSADLYIRGSRPVRLTDAGEALLGPARRAVSAMEEAGAAVAERNALEHGTLTIGVLQAAEYLVPLASALASFGAEYPGIDVRLTWVDPFAVLHGVENGELACGITAAVPGRRVNVTRTTIAREPLYLALPASHPLAEREPLRLDDLAGESFIDVHEDWTIRRINDVAFEQFDIARRVRYEVNDWELLLELVAAGAGIGFAPAGLIERVELASRRDGAGGRGKIAARTVRDHAAERKFQFVLPRGEAASRAAVEFGRHLRRATRAASAEASEA